MYPLNMHKTPPEVGFACANTQAEHIALTHGGYEPAYVAVEAPASDRDALIAQGEAKGLKVDKRWSDARLAEEVAKA